MNQPTNLLSAVEALTKKVEDLSKEVATLTTRLTEFEQEFGHSHEDEPEYATAKNLSTVADTANETHQLAQLLNGELGALKEALGVNPLPTVAGIRQTLASMIHWELMRINYGDEYAEAAWTMQANKAMDQGYANVQRAPYWRQ